LKKLKYKRQLKLNELLIKRNDDLSNGTCCNNIKYVNYDRRINKSSSKAPIFNKKKSLKIKAISTSNYCLEIFSANIARWRLCSVAPIDIYRLHLKLIFSIIKGRSKLKNPREVKKVIEKFLSNSMLAPDPVNRNWNWENQKKWNGKCKSKFMQSPQKIENSSVTEGQQPGLSVSYNIFNTHVEVVKRYSEIVVKFKNDPGLLRIAVGNKYILYRPKYISFRFPGEHNLLGKRSNGDMQLHCEEFVIDEKLKRTNGLIVTIPLEASNHYANFKPFESLSIDFWKHFIKKNGKYEPTNFITKKKQIFKLSKVFKAIVAKKSLCIIFI